MGPRYSFRRMGVAALAISTALLVGAPLARADVTGPACVTDAGHLTINGRRSYGECRGGTAVALVNIDAPPVAQTCAAPDGKPWDCGRWAAYVLVELTKKKDVTCKGNATDGDGNLVAVCYTGDRDLNRTLVELGWAVPLVGDGGPYAEAVETARSKRVGLWQGTFERPSVWRSRHPER